jgi:hypothetical protein
MNNLHYNICYMKLLNLFSGLSPPKKSAARCSCTQCPYSFASLEEFSRHKCCQVETEICEDSSDSLVDVRTEEDSKSIREAIRGYSLQEVVAIWKAENAPQIDHYKHFTEFISRTVKRPYSCRSCKSKFRFLSTLRIHMRAHSGKQLCCAPKEFCWIGCVENAYAATPREEPLGMQCVR